MILGLVSASVSGVGGERGSFLTLSVRSSDQGVWRELHIILISELRIQVTDDDF